MIDYKKVKKECDRLNIYPKQFYSPFDSNFENYPWVCLLSERSLGKTTGWLLLAMVANKVCGTVAEYVRLTGDMIKKKALDNLFDTIISCDYVSKITEGRWNSVYYFSNKWRYANIDDDGKIIERCPDHFLHVYDLCHTNGLKSTYNNPVGDLIIVDEFVDNQTPFNDFFFYLCDSMSTIFRTREGCKCVMLSNTINPRSIWFTEMGIMNEVNCCKIGERKLCRSGESVVYLEIVSNKNVSAVKKKINKAYFGFKNPKLNAITGCDTWAYSEFPIWTEKYTDEENNIKRYEYEFIHTNIFIKSDGFYNQCILAYHELYGKCVFCRPWSIEPHDDDIILVNYAPERKNEYNVRECKRLFDVLFKELYNNDKWYYKNNTSAISIRSFISQMKK